MKKITAALAGNPNSGKTTLFNDLTGSRQHIGNYPGVTVEKKEGIRCHKGYEINFVDLPGTYSLAGNSVEELIARDYIIQNRPDVVVDIVDASNFERHLYLAAQLFEMNIPMVLVLNMIDIAAKQGMQFNCAKTAEYFNCPVIATVGTKGTGIDALLEAVISTAAAPSAAPHHGKIDYGTDIEQQIAKLEPLIIQSGLRENTRNPRWLAVKLLERDTQIQQQLHNSVLSSEAQSSIEYIEKIFGDSSEVVIAEKRYGFISGVYEQVFTQTAQKRHDISDMIDKVLLNRVLGLPIFLAMMYLVFKLTFTVGDPFMGIIETGFAWLGDFISGLWPQGSDSAIISLLVDGIIGGVGGVVVFLPNILLLFLAIAILEDSGYMARAAFIMDRIMKTIGLHGRSFIPMMIGFGCSIPAIMGTRILEDRKSRFTTILILPLMSCGARLPIYALIIPAFFAPQFHGLVMWSIYIIGIVIAIILARILRLTLFKGSSGAFIMELPPYRMPTIRGLLIHLWQRSGLYLKKAGTVILAISILLWVLTTYPKPTAAALEGLDENQQQQLSLTHSAAGRIGMAMEPAIKYMGFDYRIGTALIGALAAKEVFVAQMGIVYSIGQADEESQSLREKLTDNYTPLQGFCIMLFCLISAPCVATLAVCRRETNSWKWAFFQFFGLTAIAYVITVIVYQTGTLFM